MARKKKHEEHENHERWLVSYADFITLLFAFFVVMYSVSSVNEGKYRVMSDSLLSAFRTSPKSIEPVQVGQPARSQTMTNQNHPMALASTGIVPPLQLPSPPKNDKAAELAAAKAQLEAERKQVITKMAEEIEEAMASLIKKDLVTIRRGNSWMEVEIKTSILFPSGSAKLSASASATLGKIATILGQHPNSIHVEGFTDNQPIRTVAFPSNWELSSARAASVVHLFSDKGFKAERMAAIGYGEYHPIADNATAEGRNANRRVVLVVLADPNAFRMRDLTTEVDSISQSGAEPAAGVPVPAATPGAATTAEPVPALDAGKS